MFEFLGRLFKPQIDYTDDLVGQIIQKDEAKLDPYGEKYRDSLLKVTEKEHNELMGGQLLQVGANKYTSNGALYNALTKGAGDKLSLAEKLDKIREFDFVDSILRDLATDVLTRGFDRDQAEFFVFTSKKSTNIPNNAELDAKINIDLKSLKIYDILFEVMESYLFYGQYIFKMDYVANELDDVVDQNNSIPAYSKSEMVKVYDIDESMLKDPANYLVLNLFSSHKRLKVKSDSGSYYYLKMPRGIISESLIDKIINLKILESLQPLVEIQAIDEKMYFHINFPPGKNAAEAYNECRNYEKLIKSMLNMEKDNTNNIDSILDRISSVKVIPLFGTQSEMRPQTINKVNRIDLAQVTDLRNSISNSLKINIANQNDTNAEYYKLIKRVRNQLRISITEFLVGFIKQRYSLDISVEDIDVKVPEVQGAEDLDTIDYINLHQSTYNSVLDLVQNTVKTVNALASSPLIDKKELIDSYSDQLLKITGSRIFKNYEELNSTNPEFLENPPPPTDE